LIFLNSTVTGGDLSRAAAAADLLHLKAQTAFPDVSAGKYTAGYTKILDAWTGHDPAEPGQLSVALIGRHPDSAVASAASRLEQDLAGSGIDVLSFSAAALLEVSPSSRQADVDRALLERVVEVASTPHILLIECTTAVPAGIVMAYAAGIADSAPNVAVLNLTATDGHPLPTEVDAGNLDFDFDFDFDFDAEPGAVATPSSHGLVLNELLLPGFAVAMETSRLRDSIPAMAPMPYPWLVAGLLRDAHLDGLHLYRYGAVVPGQADTWSPAARTPIQAQEEASGQRLNGVTVSIAAAHVGRETLTATIDSLLLSEDVALNICVLGLGPDESLTIADAYAATGLVRVTPHLSAAPGTLVQMGVEAGLVFEPQSLRKILDAAAALDYSVLRLVTGPSDSKVEVWPTALLSTALRHAEDGNIDEFVLSHGREHWNSGSKFGLTAEAPTTAFTAR
jgi:hypothetical protein